MNHVFRQLWFGFLPLVIAVVSMLPVTVRSAGRPFEPYMVVVPEAELYQGTKRSPIRLTWGDVVTARPDDLYHDWLDVVVDDTGFQGPSSYSARGDARASMGTARSTDSGGEGFPGAVPHGQSARKQRILQANGAQFSRLVDLRRGYARRTAELTARLEELGDDIASLQTLIEQLYAAEKAIVFDSTVRYRSRTVVPMATATATPSEGEVVPEPLPAKIEYTYEDKIDPARARNQADRWQRERRDLERKLASRREKRRDTMIRKSATDSLLDFVTWRFSSYRLGSGILHDEPYVSIRGRAQLFDGKRLAAELDTDVVLPAARNRNDDQWLIVRFQGRSFDARRSDFLNRLGVESRLGRRVVWLSEKIADVTERNRLLQDRRDMLAAITISADYNSQLNYLRLTSQPFAPVYAGSRYYAPPACPTGAVEYISQARARSFVRECEDDIKDIEDEIGRNRRNLRAWKHELAGLKPRLENLRERMNMALSSLPGEAARTPATKR